MHQIAFAQISLANLKAKAVGTYGEIIVAALFEQSGYDVATTGRGTKRGDLRVFDALTGEFWDIEVKTARPNKTGRFQFCLRRDGGMCDCGHADYVVLLAALPSGRCITFLIPVAKLGTYKTLTITADPEKYAGKWKEFRLSGEMRLN